jgi:hypothetical protein
VSGIHERSQISQAVAWSFVCEGGGGAAVMVTRKLVRIGVRNSVRVVSRGRILYVVRDSVIDGSSGVSMELAVCLGSGSGYAA